MPVVSILRRVVLPVVLLLVLGVPQSRAQPAASLQSPATFLGYELGERFTPHHRVVDYVRHVAAQSPNVSVEQYGTTHEGRPLLLATVAGADNRDRLEQIRTDNLRRAGMAAGDPQGPPTAVVWLSYNVHGNESVSTEAAMQTLYALGNPQNERTQRWLENTVVLIDPCLNPDGRARYVQWYRQMKGASYNARPEAREHDEPWPGGRTNHYYFDLNRDWAWGVQQETRHRLDAYHDWMPHVHVDFHEQSVDDPYYFAPAAKPFHENITEWQREFQFTIGRNNAKYFDRNHWLYFTREVFDLFYPGYGDTWPIFNGAIGMTYEQGGSGRAGLGIVTAEGDTLTLADRIAHHHTSGLSTVEATAQNHEQVVQEFADYYDTAEQDPPGDYETYVVKRDAGGDRLQAFAEHLDRQRIRYGVASEAQDIRGRSYATGETERTAIESGDLVVQAAQPKARLVKVLFEPETTIIDSLTYDITSWSLPYAYGLDAYALPDRVAPPTQNAVPQETGVRGSAESPYAYLTPWSSRADARFAAALLNREVSLRFATEPFTHNDRTYAPGTLILTRAGNEPLGDRFDAIVREVAAEHNQPLQAVATGFMDSGPDFGSDNVGYVDAPHVAVLSGPPTSSNSTGEVWHFFDRQIHYPATLLNADAFSADALDDVDVLVLPDGRYDDWLSEARTDALTDWVRDGGRLVALGNANDDLAGHSAFAIQHKEATTSENDDDGADEPTYGGDGEIADASDPLRRYGNRERARLPEATPGSIHRTRTDTSHPLAFGVHDPYFTLKRSDEAFAYLENDWNVVTLPAGAPVSGFMGHEAQADVAETLVYGVQEMGRGRVVYMIDNPLFRGFWYSGHLLFSNAVFFVGNG